MQLDEISGNFAEVVTSVDITQSNLELVTRYFQNHCFLTETRYSTSLRTEKKFYTDLNGFQMAQRKTRDDRFCLKNYVTL